MDVRCDKCQTEYELDETKLRPGGVTVKCTHCGYMFKVRKRSKTQQGPAVAAVAPAPAAAEASPEVPPGEGGERTWLIRLDDGEVTTCRELAALQKWIVAGRVSRTCEISRTGKKWKQLGEIGELASFFDIADEAREVAAGKRAPTAKRAAARGSGPPAGSGRRSPRPPTGGHPRTIPRAPSSAPPPPPAPKRALGSTPQPRAASEDEPTTIPRARAKDTAPEPASSPMDTVRDLAAGPMQTAPDQPPGPAKAAAPPAHVPHQAPPSAPPVPGPAAPPQAAAPAPAKREAPKLEAEAPDELRTTAKWASQRKPPPRPEEGPVGPVGGLAKGVPTDDVAFAPSAKKKKPALEIKGEYEDGRFVASDLDDDLKPARNAIARWIVLVSLLVIAGAVAFVFLFVLRDRESAAEASGGAAADAGAVVEEAAAESADAAPADSHLDPSETLARARDAIRGGNAADLEQVDSDLAKLPGADPSAEEPDHAILAARAQVEAVLAQRLVDQAASADAAQKRELERRAKERAGAARQMAEKALKLEPGEAGAMVALADSLRLARRPAREIERWLRRALRADSGDREPLYSRGLLEIRDKHFREARRLYERLAREADSGDVRARYRLAQLALADDDYDEAKEHVTAVLDARPEHEGAARIKEQIEKATEVAESDPMPPEEGPDHSGDSGHSGGGADSYDRLLARADKLATGGNCGAAMEVYERALDVNPSGVAALTGLGYCHIDARQFASAHAKFRAALGISPRYQPALWGMAEMYQQQGLKKEAIAAYRKFLSEFPNGNRAAMAKRQIERLGGTVDEGGSGSGGGAGSESGGAGSESGGGAGTDSGASTHPGSDDGDSPSPKAGDSAGGTESPAGQGTPDTDENQE